MLGLEGAPPPPGAATKLFPPLLSDVRHLVTELAAEQTGSSRWTS